MSKDYVHTFRCEVCDKDVRHTVPDRDNSLAAEEWHRNECRLGPVHRMVNFETSAREYGSACCGYEGPERMTQMPSSVTCEYCLTAAPRLQVYGILERAMTPENAAYGFLSAETLDRVRAELAANRP